MVLGLRVVHYVLVNCSHFLVRQVLSAQSSFSQMMSSSRPLFLLPSRCRGHSPCPSSPLHLPAVPSTGRPCPHSLAQKSW